MANKKDEALRKAARRVLSIFVDEIDFPFVSREFDWAIEATHHEAKYNPVDLDEIYNDIATQLTYDETRQYALETEGQAYFDRAWGGRDNFNHTKQYFLKNDDGTMTGGTIYGGLGNLASLARAEEIEPDDIMPTISRIKNDMAKFEFHMERYQACLEYQTSQAGQAASFIAGSLKGAKGEFFGDASIESLLQAFNEIVRTDNQETAVEDILCNYLKDKGVDSPLVLDLVRASTHDVFDINGGFQPKKMHQFFSRLERNIRGNMETCGPIIKYCKDTRDHIDRIIQQECHKANIEL